MLHVRKGEDNEERLPIVSAGEPVEAVAADNLVLSRRSIEFDADLVASVGSQNLRQLIDSDRSNRTFSS